MTRRLRPKTLWPWLAAAAALHGVLTLLIGREGASSLATRSPPVKHVKDLFEVELMNEPSIQRAASSVNEVEPLAPEVSNARSPSQAKGAEPKVDDEKQSQDGPRRAGELAQPRIESPSDTARVNNLEGSAGASAAEATVGRLPNQPTEPDSKAQPTDAREGPALSLADMGYGTPHAAALKPYLNVNPTAIAQNRLDQNLAQAVIDRDRDRSNGIEGPITHALHTAAMAVVVPTSLSKIAIIVGSNGKLADVQIISTNQDARALAQLSTRLKTLLANQTIRVPNGRAVEFTYELKSDVQLPSGRAPGLGVEVLGLPLKEGRADNSTKISILTPKFKFGPVNEPDPERNGKVTQTPPQLVVGISVLGIDGDLVDVGSNERQVIHTRLIRQRVL